MPILSTLKDPRKESKLYLSRVLIATVVMVICTLILIGRLVYFQIIQHHRYSLLSRNNQLKITPIPPTRGLIYDRFGQLLATNVPTFSLEMIRQKIANIPSTLAELKTLISITPAQEQAFYKQLRYTRNRESVPIRLKLTELEVARFSLHKHHFPGIEVVAHPIRHYPFSTLFAHVLGYIGPLNDQDLANINKIKYRGTYHIGKTGLEKFYESTLHGKVGYQHIETDAHGHIVRVTGNTPPVPGDNLILGIDLNLQIVAFKAMGNLKGAVVALDPQTGDILAMVSTPTFDPNLFTQGIDVASYDTLQNASDRPLFNRVINGLYPPASTVKPLAALQGLASKHISTQTTMFDPGWFQLSEDSRKYRDWKPAGHGHVNLEKALSQSCDTYFFVLAQKLGGAALADVYQQFGLGKQTGIDFPHESSGLVPTDAWKQQVKKESWYPGDTLNMGIGQGFSLSTPLQIAQLAAILANRGTFFPPRLVIATSNTDNTNFTAPEIPPPFTITNFRPEQWAAIIEGMRKTVQPGGTAQKISQGLKYSIAGKTGTAQVFNLKTDQKYEVDKVKAHLRDHSWFMGFAPVDNPKIAIAVLIENKYQTTSSEVARRILDYFFSHLDNLP
jgi:penicillin-binding protein 2